LDDCPIRRTRWLENPRTGLLALRGLLRQLTGSMFELTGQERKLVAFVLAAFVAGLGLKHWRDTRAVTAAAEQVEER